MTKLAAQLAEMSSLVAQMQSAASDLSWRTERCRAAAERAVGQDHRACGPVDTATLLLKAFNLRLEAFGSMVHDPVSNILLDLYVREAAGQRTSVSTATVASRVPPATALRWLKQLEEAGLIVRNGDPRDARRVFLSLTEQAHKRLTHVLLGAGEGLLLATPEPGES